MLLPSPLPFLAIVLASFWPPRMKSKPPPPPAFVMAPSRLPTPEEQFDTLALICRRYGDFMESRLPRLEAEMKTIGDVLRERAAVVLPNPEHTPAGGIRFEPEAWGEVKDTIEQFRRNAEIREAEMRGAKAALAELEAQAAARERVNDRRLDRAMKLVKIATILIPVVSAITGIITHLLRSP